MKRKVYVFLLTLIFVVTAFSACSDDSEKDMRIAELESQVEDLNDTVALLSEQIADPGIDNDSVLAKAFAVVKLIADKDMQGFSAYVHPVKGVRFSPYGYIDTGSGMVFSSDETALLMSSSQVYTWGAYDGSGEPIELSFSDYYDRFIYDQDFTAPQVIGNNVIVGTGNSMINIDEVFPDGIFVEFHFNGFDPQYEGMDWRSLRIIFEEYEGEWYVVAIVHDEWTI